MSAVDEAGSGPAAPAAGGTAGAAGTGTAGTGTVGTGGAGTSTAGTDTTGTVGTGIAGTALGVAASSPGVRGPRGDLAAVRHGRALGPIALAAAGSFLLHALAVLWVWHFWSGFGRGGVLAWIDFPSSLAYLRLRGGAKLAWSLSIGGSQWAVLGATLSLLFGKSARRPTN